MGWVILLVLVVILEITAYLIVIIAIGENKPMHKKYNIKAKKEFIDEQNNIQKTALAKGEKMKSADADASEAKLEGC